MSRIKLFGRYYLGTGLISVVGTSFATLSTANAVRGATDHVMPPDILYLARYLTLCMLMGHAHPQLLTQESSLEDLVPTLMAKS
jgi:hypothetical protein